MRNLKLLQRSRGGHCVTCGTIPLRFCFIMPDIKSGFVIICSCADFCSDFWLRTPLPYNASTKQLQTD